MEDTNISIADAKRQQKSNAKAAAEVAAGKITPDHYWALYMSFKAMHQGSPIWNRKSFLSFLHEKRSDIGVEPDNTRIYQKHAYCIKRWEKLKEAQQIPRFNAKDFPLPPTSRSVGDAAFISQAGNLYPDG